MPIDPDELNKKSKGNGQDKPNNGKNDFVGSSFAVQFKPGDKANSVSDKLKESANDGPDDFDAFKDEFDDFVFDESITPFKPAENSESAKPAFEPKGGAQPVRPAHAAPAAQSRPAAAPEKKNDSGIPSFPKDGGTFDRKPSDNVSKGPDKSNTPVFGSDGKGKPSGPASEKDEKLFNSGKNLDYATSEHDKNKSPFANAKRPDMPTSDEVNIPKAEKKPEVKTYGTVSSGVNAFGSDKSQDKAPEAAKDEKGGTSPFVIRPTPSPKPAAPKEEPAKPAAHVPPAAAKSAQNDKPAHTPPAAAKAEKDANDSKSAPAAHTPPAAHKAPKAPAQEAPAKSIIPGKEAAPAAASAEAAEKTVGQRPGEAAKQKAPVLSRPAPTGAAIDSIRPEDPRRMLAVEKSQKDVSSTPHEKPNISPVDTVKKTRKKKETKSAKDPGVGGIIALVIIIAAFIAILLLLQNLDKISSVFGRKPVETLPTVQTTTTAVVTTTESTTEATTESTTEATTTEATTESTTEATTTTTEATTKATTKATQATTKATSSGNTSTGIATKNFKTKVSNFRGTSNGFKFDISMTNGSGKTASLKKSLNNFSIQLECSSSIKSLSSNYLTFKYKNGYWVGTPKDVSIKPNQKLTITVTVSTKGKPAYFAYTKSNFKWN